MTPPERVVSVLGLGLVGGSVAAAARHFGAADRVIGYDHAAAERETALERGLVDECRSSAAEACAGADLVILATPVAAMGAVLRDAAAGLASEAVVTDVGSVKTTLADTLPALLPAGVRYVGSHPMAGGHRGGAGQARASLFEGVVVVVTGEGGPARDRVVQFWKQLRALVEFRSPGDHDLEVAWTSHLPHVLAFAFAGAFGEAPESAKRLVGAGFRDFARIARSDPRLWAGILSANAKSLVGPLEQSAAWVRELATALESADEAELELILAKARKGLDDIPES